MGIDFETDAEITFNVDDIPSGLQSPKLVSVEFTEEQLKLLESRLPELVVKERRAQEHAGSMLLGGQASKLKGALNRIRRALDENGEGQ